MVAKKKATKKTTRKAAPREPSNLVKMAKNGEVINVHPKCVNEHMKLGWSRG